MTDGRWTKFRCGGCVERHALFADLGGPRLRVPPASIGDAVGQAGAVVLASIALDYTD